MSSDTLFPMPEREEPQTRRYLREHVTYPEACVLFLINSTPTDDFQPMVWHSLHGFFLNDWASRLYERGFLSRKRIHEEGFRYWVYSLTESGEAARDEHLIEYIPIERLNTEKPI